MLIEGRIEDLIENEKERKLFLEFLDDPLRTVGKILDYFKIESSTDLKITALARDSSALLEALVKYMLAKDWFYRDEEDELRFIWERWTSVRVRGTEVPATEKDFEALKRIKMWLLELKAKEADDFLFMQVSLPIEEERTAVKVWWNGDFLYFEKNLVSKILGREVRSASILSFEEGLKIVDFLLGTYKKSSTKRRTLLRQFSSSPPWSW